VTLRIAVDRPQALVAIRLNDVRPDGSITRITYGVLNLTHRESHTHPEPLEPGRFYEVRIALNEIGQQLPPGHRLRVSISSNYWPMIWPAAESAMLTLDPSGCSLSVPLLDEDAAQSVSFEPVSIATPLQLTELKPGQETRQILRDIETQTTTYIISRDDGVTRIDDIGTEIALTKEKRMMVTGDDPLSSAASVKTQFSYHRGQWQATTETFTHLSCDRNYFYLRATVSASCHGVVFFERDFDYRIERDNV